jgi:hypothetical protein
MRGAEVGQSTRAGQLFEFVFVELGNTAGEIVDIAVGLAGGDQVTGLGAETADVTEAETETERRGW